MSACVSERVNVCEMVNKREYVCVCKGEIIRE